MLLVCLTGAISRSSFIHLGISEENVYDVYQKLDLVENVVVSGKAIH